MDSIFNGVGVMKHSWKDEDMGSYACSKCGHGISLGDINIIKQIPDPLSISKNKIWIHKDPEACFQAVRNRLSNTVGVLNDTRQNLKSLERRIEELERRERLPWYKR